MCERRGHLMRGILGVQILYAVNLLVVDVKTAKT